MTSASHSPVRLFRFGLIFTSILVLFHVYLGWRLLPSLCPELLPWPVGMLLLAISVALISLGMFARFLISDQGLSDKVTWLGSITMGLFSSLLVLTLLRDILLIPIRAARFDYISAYLVLVLAALVTFIGFVNARRLPRITHVDIALEELPQALVGFSIVQISDIHVGPTIKGDYVEAIVERVNSLDADLVAITGDVVDGSVQQLTRHTLPLAKLSSRHGSFFVTGNHEYYSGVSEWLQEFRRLGLHCLVNEHVLIEHDGAQLLVAGVSDFSAHQFDPHQRSDPQAALKNAPAGIIKLLLAHQPRTAKAAAAAGYDLQLSGHTHGGQFWPWNLFVRLQQPFIAGLHRQGSMWVYISRGTGYWGPPKRFGVPSEITRLRLVKSNKQKTETLP